MAAVISSDGYALTAHHVVDGLNPMNVTQSNRETQRLHLSMSPKKAKPQSLTQSRLRMLEFPQQQTGRFFCLKKFQLSIAFPVKTSPSLRFIPLKRPTLKLERHPPLVTSSLARATESAQHLLLRRAQPSKSKKMGRIF